MPRPGYVFGVCYSRVEYHKLQKALGIAPEDRIPWHRHRAMNEKAMEDMRAQGVPACWIELTAQQVLDFARLTETPPQEAGKYLAALIGNNRLERGEIK